MQKIYPLSKEDFKSFEKYKNYKNQYEDLITNKFDILLISINNSSLKEEDKLLLRKTLIIQLLNQI